MCDFWHNALPLLFAAVVATLLGYFFNRWLMKSTQQWQENQDSIRSGEKFCDDLLELTTHYWHMNLNVLGPKTEAKILAGKIIASIMLITRFVDENYATNTNMQEDLKKMVACVTGGNYDVFNRLPDANRSSASAGSIIQLRFAFSNSIKDSLNYDNP